MAARTRLFIDVPVALRHGRTRLFLDGERVSGVCGLDPKSPAGEVFLEKRSGASNVVAVAQEHLAV